MKILVVLPRFPYPLEKGDKLRAYHQIVELSKRHEIYLFAVSHTKVTAEQRAALEPYCKSISVVTPTCFTAGFNVLRNYFRSKSLQMGYWDSARARRTVKELAKKIQPDIVYNQMVRTVPFVARLPFPKVMDFQDSLSLNTERRMEQSKGLWRSVLHYEFKMLRSTEYNAFKIFDALTIISEVDSEAIPHKKNGEILLVPNGVDFDYFSSSQLSVASSQSATASALTTDHRPLATYSLVFCGNLSYAPNIDAARYLVHEVMPLVWAQDSSVTLLLAGADPKPSVRALASDRVTLQASLPDIRSAYASADIFVAPMRIGSGLQNKLLEAMSMNLPCVTTSLAAKPILAATQSEAHSQPLLVADNPHAFADSILKLLSDKDLAAQIAQEGSAFVRQHYSWESAVKPLEDIFNEVVRKNEHI